MTRASEPKYAPGYDLFKLVVAVILTMLLIFLLLLNRPQPVAPPPATPIPPGASPTGTISPATNTVQPPAPTALPPTATTEPSSAPIVPTGTTTSSPTPIPPTPALTATLTPDATACPAASSRVHIGDSLRVLTRLNLRVGPGLNSAIIKTNNPGATLQVIGGPVCLRLDLTAGSRAYLWWQVRTQNGQQGWSAEASLITPSYFLSPIK